MNLEKIRKQIDAIDEELQALINQRASLAQEVAKTKLAEDPKAVFYRPEREAQVLRNIVAQNKGPLEDEAIRHLFREVMSACLALEQPVKVAYLGPIGTYTQQAAVKQFGSFAEVLPLNSIRDVFREVSLGEADYGVVPVENSTEGVISNTLDQFIHSDLKICGEVEIPIHHNLMTQGCALEEVKRVYAHQQSLQQCKHWLDNNLSKAMQIPVSSNAEAARMTQTAKDSAAIASEMAAEVYGLNVLVRNIEDEAKNTTRFLVIGNTIPEPSGHDKTSLLLTTDNKSGALHRLLQPFSTHGISLTKIESRPSRRANWDYVFFVDVEGHKEDASIQKALTDLDTNQQIISVLGSYPRST